MEFIKKYYWLNAPISRLKLVLYLATIILSSIGIFTVGKAMDIESIGVLEVSSYIVSLILVYFLLRRTYSISAEARSFVLAIVALYAFLEVISAYLIYEHVITVAVPLFVWFILLILFEDAKKKPEIVHEKIDSETSKKDFIINLFFNKDGRLNRSAFFYSIALIGFLSSLIAYTLDDIKVENSNTYYFISQTILFLVFLWPNYCLYNKRVNDFNGRKTTTYLLAVILPVIIYAISFKLVYMIEIQGVVNIEQAFLTDDFAGYAIALSLMVIVYIAMFIQVVFKEPTYDESNPVNDRSVNKHTNILRDIFIVVAGLAMAYNLNSNYDDIAKYTNLILESNKGNPVVMTYSGKNKQDLKNAIIIQNCMQGIVDNRFSKKRINYFITLPRQNKIHTISTLIDRTCRLDEFVSSNKTGVKSKMVAILLEIAKNKAANR